jgi:hypothetical protein
LVGKAKEKRSLGKHRRWRQDINTDGQEMG